MASSIFRAGNTAVITGGASGIGLALAKRCVQSGMKTLVVDRDAELLAAASTNAGGGVSTFEMDVSKEDEWKGLKGFVDSELGGRVSLLALNAGIGRKSSWDDPSSFREVINTNVFGVINGVAALLPAVKRAAEHAAIIITGSKQGITNPPGPSPAYNMSKAALKAYAEQLSFDLRSSSSPTISVHLFVPGFTFTGMMGNRPGKEKEKPAGSWYPEQAVDYLVGKMGEGMFYVICPDDEVSEEMDRKRMLWSAGDVVEGRPPLTRWRDEWKARAQEWMDKQKV